MWEEFCSDLTKVLSGECIRKVRTRTENHDVEELVRDTELQIPTMKKTVSAFTDGLDTELQIPTTKKTVPAFTDGLGVTDAANAEVRYAGASPCIAAVWARSSIPLGAERRRKSRLRRG